MGERETPFWTSLSARVIILVLLPLIVQLGFLVGLAKMNSQSEELLQRSIKSKKIADGINQLSKDAYELGAQLAFGGGTPGGDEAFMSFIGRPVSDLRRLKELAKDQPELMQYLDSAEMSMFQAQEVLRKIKDADARGISHLEIGLLWMEFRKHMKATLYNDLLELSRRESVVAEKDEDNQAEYRKLLEKFTLFGAAGIVLISACAAFFVVREITGRIKLLTENTNKLANNQPLHEPVKGNDEIARLDQTFHKMAFELQEAARKEREAEQLRRDMVHMLTHDLKTPLASLSATFEFLLSGRHGQLDEKGSGYVKAGQGNVSKLAVLVGDFLDIERIKAGQMPINKSKFLLDESFAACEESLAALAEEKNVKLDLQKTDIAVKADPDMVDRILINLVGNALKFSRKGKTITVAAKRSDENFATISVSDEGAGIDSKQQEVIFERFRQAEGTATGGTGLGLSICKAFTELNGGKIWVESKVNEGTTFFFSLPLG